MTGKATRYEILEPSGAGPHGPCYKARDRELERLVLLWLLPADLFRDDGERRRCLDRATAVAALHHPGLLPLHESGETGDGGLFLAFAWAEGETLARRLEAGPLKPAVAVDLTMQTAAGLALAHERGIVHGHLDPASLLVTSSGEAKLFDLSAAGLGERTWSDAAGARTEAWLAPEQRQGLVADARSDVWGLGAMLYEMMTGVRPRPGAQEPLRALRPDASGHLERIVARALSAAPAGRHAGAWELQRDLAALAQSGSRPVATAPPAPRPPADPTIGHYRLLEPLGGGGMGLVVRAEDTHLGRTVALKLLPPELARDPVAKRRFFQEARTASALEHPNLCTIYDAGEADDGRLWLAMPCYDGETLRSRLERGPLPVDEAVDVARQVALGLAKAHRQGIVHRDVKPANLMLTADGVVKILDFGIAKLAGEARLTRTGVAIGTPTYMSPEQALGQEVDHRTDLWALGVVLYEMLAGRRPFPGEHGAAVLEGILHREPERLVPKRPEVPPLLEDIVRKLLAKDPERRYASAEALAGDLRSLVGHSSTGVMHPPAARSPQRSVRVAAALLLLVLVLAGGLALRRLRPGERAGSGGEPKFMRLTDQQGVELFPSLSPSGDFFVYAKRDGGDLDLFLQRVGGTQPLNLTAGSPADDSQPAYSPDGRSIAFRSERDGGGLFVMGATGESVRRLVGFGYQPAWSPDGRAIAFSTAGVSDPMHRPRLGEIWRIDLGAGRPRLVVGEDAVQPSWSPDGSRIAYWSAGGSTGRRSIRTIASDGRGPAIPLTHETDVDWSPAWSPEGAIYFSSNRSGSMNLWHIAVDGRTGKNLSPPEPVRIPAQWAGFPSFSADGRKMVYATREKRVNLERMRLDPDGPRVVGEPEPVTRGTSTFNYASVSPDGEWIVLSLFGEREDLTVVHRDGGVLRRLTDDGFKDRVGVWAPDGRILFYSDRQGRYNAWSIQADGSDLQPLLAGETEMVFHPVPSPDGTAVAVCGESAGAAVVDLTRPLEERRLRRLPAAPWGPFCANSWSGDGERLVGTVSGLVVSFSLRTGRYEKLGSGGSAFWMADGRRVLFLDPEGALRMTDTATGETRPLLRRPRDSSFEGYALSPDNRWIYLLRSTEEGDLWMSY